MLLHLVRTKMTRKVPWHVSKTQSASQTWDGLPASTVAPFGAAVVVYRFGREDLEILLLHRAHHGPEYDGDWAWTPPTGCRFPDELIEACAERELFEECGLKAAIDFTNFGDDDWPMFSAQVASDAIITLHDPEHDRWQWVSPEEALRLCNPEIIKQPLRKAIAALQPKAGAAAQNNI